MSLNWKFAMKRDDEAKVVEVDGTTRVGHQTVHAVVKPKHIELTIKGTMTMPDAGHLLELVDVLNDLQGELNQ